MKRTFLLVLMLLGMPLSVDASNKIHSIDIDIYLNQDGSVNITETWDVDGDDGTEWYKVMNNLGESKLSNFKVSMDGRDLQYKNWNVNESLSEKSGYYGIEYTGDGLELCFGKYDYDRHTFVLNYDLSNFVFNTSDSQVIYFNLIDKLSDVDFDSFSVTVSSYYTFPDSLDVWGYGYEGYAYVSDGKIEMSNKDNNMNNDYVVLLAKFPLGTFTNTSYVVDDYDNFDDVLNKAEKGTFWNSSLIQILKFLGYVSFWVFVYVFCIIYKFCNTIGFENNEGVVQSRCLEYNKIPYIKSIYYTIGIILVNNGVINRNKFFRIILLKWYNEKKIGFSAENDDCEKKIYLNLLNPKDLTFENKYERKLYLIMYRLSRGKQLDSKKIKLWFRVHMISTYLIFKNIKKYSIKLLKDEKLIYKREKISLNKSYLVADEVIYNDLVKLYGFKNYMKKNKNLDELEIKNFNDIENFVLLCCLLDVCYFKKINNKISAFIESNKKNIKHNNNNNYNYSASEFVRDVRWTEYYSKSTCGKSPFSKIIDNFSSDSLDNGGSSSGGGEGSFGGGGGGSR